MATALKKGLSAIAVSDHFTTEGAFKAMKEAASTDLVVIPAIEVETDMGHIMGLFVKSDIRTRNVDEVLDEIRKQDGLAVLLHPTRLYTSNLKEVAEKVDVIEGLNGRTRRGENLKARNLASRFRKPIIAGSDAHMRLEIGRVMTVLEDASNSPEDIKWHILNGKSVLVGRESPYIVHAFSFGAQMAKYAMRLI